MTSYLSTSYTLLGYETTLGEAEIARGGNHRMCSETRLLPSEGPWDVNHHRMTVAEIKAVAHLAHAQAVQEHPEAVDAGCHHDRDGQDEELAMLGISTGMRPKARCQFKIENRRLYLRSMFAICWATTDMLACRPSMFY
jgi:hypothetical protein